MNHKQISITIASSRLSLPLIMTAIYYIVQCITKQTSLISDIPDGQYEGEILMHIDIPSAERIQSISIEVYHQYIQFIVTMLVMHVGVKTLMETAKHLMILYQHSKIARRILDKLNDFTARPGHYEPKEWELKGIIKYTFSLVVMYSLIYFLSFFICTCTSLVCQSAYSVSHKHNNYSLELNSYDTHQRANPLQPHPDIVYKETLYPLLKHNVRNTERKLDLLGQTNAIEGLSHLLIPNIIGITSFQDKDILMIATSTNIIPVDISDLASPIQLEPIQITQDHEIVYIIFSPNTENVFYMDDMNSIFVNNTKQKDSFTQLGITTEESGSILAVFTSNNTDGFFVTGRGLYQFYMNSSECVQLLTFANVQVMHLKLSSDEETLSIGMSSLETGDILLYIVAVSAENPPIVVQNYTLSNTGGITSMTTSSDNTVAFLLEELPSSERGFIMLNITASGSPSVINPPDTANASVNIGALMPQSDRSLVLSPDDLTVVIYSRTYLKIWDVSDLSNITTSFGSPVFFSNYLTISLDSRFVFAVKDGDFQIGRLWVNADLDRQFRFLKPRPIRIPTNRICSFCCSII